MPTCPRCGDALQSLRLHLLTRDCWSCSKPIQVAIGFVGRDTMVLPGRFTATEALAANAAGAAVRQFPRQLYNACPHCGKPFGDGYLMTEAYLADAKSKLDLGTADRCERCTEAAANPPD